MAAGVCLIFLIPYCAEKEDDFDEETRIISKATDSEIENCEKRNSDFEVVRSEKSGMGISDAPDSPEPFSSRTRFCIFPCLPVRSKSGIEEGKYCQEQENEKEDDEYDDVGSIKIENPRDSILLRKSPVI